MPAQFGRPSAAQIAAEAERKQREAEAAQVTAADSPLAVPIGQRALAGYRLVRTFSDVSQRPHRIFRAGLLVTDSREVARLAKIGAELAPVEIDDASPAVA